MAIEITDRAVEAIKTLRQKEGIDAGGLRVGVKGGGCSGLSYNLGFETEARKGDNSQQIKCISSFSIIGKASGAL